MSFVKVEIMKERLFWIVWIAQVYLINWPVRVDLGSVVCVHNTRPSMST